MTDTKETEALDTGRELDRFAQPLARALGNIRSTLAGWDEPAIWNALAATDKCSSLDPEDPDLCGAERILREALDRASAERIACNAPWLTIDIRCDRGRWNLCAWHNQGNAMQREFASFAEAKAAGDTLHAFLKLVGRDAEFSWETQPKAAPDFCDADIPF